jgi:hypothetical protein
MDSQTTASPFWRTLKNGESNAPALSKTSPLQAIKNCSLTSVHHWMRSRSKCVFSIPLKTMSVTLGTGFRPRGNPSERGKRG